MEDFQHVTPDEALVSLGESLRIVRIQQGLSQHQFAARAGVSLSALSHLENGHGSSLMTFVRVLHALGLRQGLRQLVPAGVLDPLTVTRQATPRRRASHTRKRKSLTPTAGDANGGA